MRDLAIKEVERLLGINVPPLKWFKVSNSPNSWTAHHGKYQFKIRVRCLNRANPLYAWEVIDRVVEKHKAEGDGKSLRAAKTAVRKSLMKDLDNEF